MSPDMEGDRQGQQPKRLSLVPLSLSPYRGKKE